MATVGYRQTENITQSGGTPPPNVDLPGVRYSDTQRVSGNLGSQPGGSRFQEWLQRYNAVPEIDVEAVRDALGSNASDTDVGEALVSRMLNESDASSYLSPQYRRFLKKKAGAALAQDQLRRIGQQSQANLSYTQTGQGEAWGQPGREDKDLQGILAGYAANRRQSDIPSRTAEYMQAIDRIMQLGQDPATRNQVSGLYDYLTNEYTGPSAQLELAQAALAARGYNGLYGNYAANRLRDSFNDYLTAGEQAGPSFLTYLKGFYPWN